MLCRFHLMHKPLKLSATRFLRNVYIIDVNAFIASNTRAIRKLFSILCMYVCGCGYTFYANHCESSTNTVPLCSKQIVMGFCVATVMRKERCQMRLPTHKGNNGIDTYKRGTMNPKTPHSNCTYFCRTITAKSPLLHNK